MLDPPGKKIWVRGSCLLFDVTAPTHPPNPPTRPGMTDSKAHLPLFSSSCPRGQQPPVPVNPITIECLSQTEDNLVRLGLDKKDRQSDGAVTACLSSEYPVNWNASSSR